MAGGLSLAIVEFMKVEPHATQAGGNYSRNP